MLVARKSDDDPGKLSGQWWFPGGTGEEGEDPIETARRELQEETNLISDDQDALLIHTRTRQDGDVTFVSSFVRLTVPDTSTLRPVPGTDIVEAGFLPVCEALALFSEFAWSITPAHVFKYALSHGFRKNQ